MTDVTGDLWIHDDGTECADPGDHKCRAGLVTAGFRQQTAELMDASDELLRWLADGPEDECEGAP